MADRAQVAEAVGEIAETHGGLHILVNNAGIAINGLLLRFKDDDWDRTLAVNLGGAFATSKAAARHLLKAKERGRVINITSVVGEMGNGGQSAYAAAKAGLIGLTKSLAREVASRGVTVNAVAPGFIETDMTAERAARGPASSAAVADPARPHRQRRGRGRSGGVPCRARSRLHHGPGICASTAGS